MIQMVKALSSYPKIAVVETNANSGMHGQILVFEFDEQGKTFRLIGQYNYADYFRNPQKYAN
ncbi:MAG: hypothetical protein H0Z34_11130 [Brevibacillus sp.]|nr:hypothetical protein [Brevibacillus sp.]